MRGIDKAAAMRAALRRMRFGDAEQKNAPSGAPSAITIAIHSGGPASAPGMELELGAEGAEDAEDEDDDDEAY